MKNLLKWIEKLMHLNRAKHGPRTWVYNSQKRKYSCWQTKVYKDRRTSSKKKKKKWIKRISLIFYLFKMEKESSFLEGKYSQYLQMPKLKLPFGVAVQKDKKDILNAFTLLPSNFLSRTSAQGNKQRKVKILYNDVQCSIIAWATKARKRKQLMMTRWGGRYIYGRMFAVKTFKRLPKIVFEIRVMSQRRLLMFKEKEKKKPVHLK